MRSIKEILKERLPDDIYEKAVVNRINDVIIEEEVDALCAAFCWEDTLEGFKYWEKISRTYFNDNDPVVNYHHVVDPPNENKTDAYPFFTSVSTRDSLSVLDQFAMAALGHILSKHNLMSDWSYSEKAYDIAEAMLAEKLKRENVKNENKS